MADAVRCLVLMLSLGSVTVGQSSDAPSSGDDTGSSGTRRALVLCGHPGDSAYRAKYARSVQKLYDGLTRCYGFEAEQVWVRFGSQPQADDLPAIAGCRGLSTREAIEGDVAELSRQLDPQDTLWVIVLGHAHFDGRHSHLNLPGPDIREDEFGKLFETIVAKEEVFWITTPASGFFVQHLSAKGRIVVSATEADQEVNETIFHLPLADVLSDPPEKDEYDRNGDGRLSVLDLYLTVVRRVAMMYEAAENIPTEHAQLDDNGDGRSTELQIDYLSPDLGGRAKAGEVPEFSSLLDGALAATVELLVIRPEEPPTERKPEEPFEQDSSGGAELPRFERMQIIPETK